MKKIVLGLFAITLITACNDKNSGNPSILPLTHENHSGDQHGGNHHNEGDKAVATATATSNDISSNVALTWEAFKTPAKKGVKGRFEKMNVTAPNASAESPAEKLKDASFKITTNTVKTGDDGRDETLRNEFFSKLAGDNISGVVKSVSNGKAIIALMLNGKEVEKEFSYFVSDDNPKSMLLKGSIDMVKDFAANTAFESLATACDALHEGKTWTDVSLEVQVDF